jgi:phosphatidylinositol alpha 1,6-mannosyltransferase
MRSMTVPRVALFTDSYYEANGVARTASALEVFAAERERPLLVVHGGTTNQIVEAGSVVRLELERSTRTSFNLDHDLRFDLLLWRHASRVASVLRWFRPEVLHFTGPSDVGQLGALLGHRLSIPMVGSWHTNLHEYASCRLLSHLDRLSDRMRMAIRFSVERHALAATMLFYAIPRVVLAPNDEWKGVIEARTRKPTFVMTRGVDTALFTPARRRRCDSRINVGYVGRLSVEKNVRALGALYDAVHASGLSNVRFTIVGDGAEREWLRTHVPGAMFTGVLRGDALADAYADFDVFVFPSETETVGNVVNEAMASGVPIVAMARGGPKFIAASSAFAALAHTQTELVDVAVELIRNADRRRTMGTAARECAMQRSWPAVFDVVYHAYEVAIAGARSGEQQPDGAFVAVPEKQSA